VDSCEIDKAFLFAESMAGRKARFEETTFSLMILHVLFGKEKVTASVSVFCPCNQKPAEPRLVFLLPRFAPKATFSYRQL
jgi:hypothetical protein